MGDDDGVQDACSRECVNMSSKKHREDLLKAFAEVAAEISSLPEDVFRAELAKHAEGDIAGKSVRLADALLAELSKESSK